MFNIRGYIKLQWNYQMNFYQNGKSATIRLQLSEVLEPLDIMGVRLRPPPPPEAPRKSHLSHHGYKRGFSIFFSRKKVF